MLAALPEFGNLDEVHWVSYLAVLTANGKLDDALSLTGSPARKLIGSHVKVETDPSHFDLTTPKTARDLAMWRATW